MTASTYLVKGEDASLVAQAVRALLAEVVGDRDQSLVVEEVGGGPSDDLNVGAVVDACLTPPFLVDRRVVVVRDVGRLLAADAPRLVEVVKDPLASTVLVLAAGGGAAPAALVKAVTASGEVIDVSVDKTAKRKSWLAEHLRGAPVKLDPQAAQLLGQHVGEDLGRVEGLLGALANTYGPGARISVGDLEPYLGEAGTLPAWDLTDAIDRGETQTALTVLNRMLTSGGDSPVYLLVILHRHYSNMLALDGALVSGEDEAAAIVKMAPFQAGKALKQSRRLGSAKIATAIGLLSDADYDMKGGTGLAPDLVLEILVARLARQTRPQTAARR
jgi:DNA polymerase III subunit delta